MSLDEFYQQYGEIKNNYVNWRIEKSLLRAIQTLCEQLDPLSKLELKELESRVARHLFEQLRNNPTEQIKCYWDCFLSRCSEKVVSKIINLYSTQTLNYECLFIIANSKIQCPVGFFKTFKVAGPDYRTPFYPRLKAWSSTKIKYLLIDELRKTYMTIGRTNLSLVSHCSQKRVEKALINAGYQEYFTHYLLIWTCFKKVKDSMKLAIDEWKDEHFQKVAAKYHESQPTSSLNAEEVRTILNKIGGVVREFLNSPQIVAPDPDPDPDNSVLIKIIIQVLSVLSDDKRQLLNWRYDQKMNQEQIARELSVDQGTVSRHLQQLHKEIFSIIWNKMKGSHPTASPSPTAEQLKAIKESLKLSYSLLEDEVI